MNCPACGNELTKKIVSQVELDVCEGGCGGIWFDAFELQKFDEPHESAAEILEISKNEDLIVDRSKRYQCPLCDDTVMMRHFFSVKHEVEIDECPGCAGIWLDAGELEKIRTLFDTEQQRREAGREDFQETFGQELATREAELQTKVKKARGFAKALRLVCPSYYIPGKQGWGAF